MNDDIISQQRDRVAIEAISPQIDGGRFPIKRVAGDLLKVEADVFAEGANSVVAALQLRRIGEERWQERPMAHLDNDRWGGEVALGQIGRHEYRVIAWVSPYLNWRKSMLGWLSDPASQLASDLAEGRALISASAAELGAGREAVEALLEQAEKFGDREAAALLCADELADRVAWPSGRRYASASTPLELIVDRERARFSSWYELFPRSYGPQGRHGKLRDLLNGPLQRVADLGFDVLYLPPIHPIGRIHRKGRNNALKAARGDPGSPWAIGSREGGHLAIHPQLGSLQDLQDLQGRARELGVELAMDFAIQAAPDHPWVKEHPGYFFHRQDGSIRYAENPPKRYEDIYPIHFYGEEAEALWAELEDTVEYWVAQGIAIFRVDNPHTKPFPFWERLIRNVTFRHPEVLFLAEAFTRPKVMHRLAKLGFSQSYTYFTWRNTKPELESYLAELSAGPATEYFRGNFFTNTPDILSDYLVHGGPPAFRIRLVLAATSSGNYGIYSGFEIFEREPFPGKEEYLDNEKYQLRHYDLGGGLDPLIRQLNQLRRSYPALQRSDNLRLRLTSSEQLIAYLKQGETPLLCVVNLDPHHTQEGVVSVPWWELGLGERYTAHDLLSGASYPWEGEWNYVKLGQDLPAHLLRLEPR